MGTRLSLYYKTKYMGTRLSLYYKTKYTITLG